MTTDNDRPQLVFSRLTDRPVICYHPRSHSYPVYWKGIAMVRESALLLACSVWGISNPTPKMKAAAHTEFLRAFMLGAFGDVPWERSINPEPSGYHAYLVRKLCPDSVAAVEIKRGVEPQQALAWFMPSSAEVLAD